jgi:hypothetical protein
LPYLFPKQGCNLGIKREFTTCPHVAFVEDIKKAIEDAIKEGDRVLLLLDGNMDMRDSMLSVALQTAGLEEKILR